MHYLATMKVIYDYSLQSPLRNTTVLVTAKHNNTPVAISEISTHVARLRRFLKQLWYVVAQLLSILVTFLSVLNVRKLLHKTKKCYKTSLDARACFSFQTIRDQTHSQMDCHTGQHLQPSCFFIIFYIACLLFFFFFRSFIVIWLHATFLLAKSKCAKYRTLDLLVT